MGIEISSELVVKLIRLSERLSEVVASISIANAVIPSEMLERFDKFAADNRCLNCGKDLSDDGKPVKRGTHLRCYNSLKTLIKEGAATSHEFVIQGRWRPAGSGGRPKKPLPPLPILGNGKGNVPIVGKPTPEQRNETIKQGNQAEANLKKVTPKEGSGATKPKKGVKK